MLEVCFIWGIAVDYYCVRLVVGVFVFRFFLWFLCLFLEGFKIEVSRLVVREEGEGFLYGSGFLVIVGF